MDCRRGYTLIEIIVAVLVFTVGGLALASAGAVIIRAMALNGRRENATRLATSRLEQLRSTCDSAPNGADSARGVRLRWNVVDKSPSVRVVATVTYPTPSGVHTETFHASFACP